MRDVPELAHRLDHVHGDADGAGMIGDGAGNGLANPPGRVGAELVAAPVLVLVHGAHQAGVAFLDDVQERQAAVAVFLGDGDDEPQVAAGELALGVLVLGEDVLDATGSRGLSQLLGGLHDQRQIMEPCELLRFIASVSSESWAVMSRVVAAQLVPGSSSVILSGTWRSELPHHRGDAAGAERKLLEEQSRPFGGGCWFMPLGWPALVARRRELRVVADFRAQSAAVQLACSFWTVAQVRRAGA